MALSPSEKASAHQGKLEEYGKEISKFVCINCRSKYRFTKKSLEKKEAQQEKTKISRQQADSKYPMQWLSPFSIKERIKNLKAERKAKKSKK